VNLAEGKITVRASKTDAVVRTVYMLPVLRGELDRYPASVYPTPETLVFGTSTGGRQGATNVRRRILAPAVVRANEQLVKGEREPRPEGLSPHGLRRTFASLLFAIGDNTRRVMTQMGHPTRVVAVDLRAGNGQRRRRARAAARARERRGVGTGARTAPRADERLAPDRRPAGL
jgi:integrase